MISIVSNNKFQFNIKSFANLLMYPKNEVHYIGGTEILPAPLSPEEEAELISRIDYEDNVRQTLIEHNLRLVVYIAKKFDNTGIGVEDLISIGTIGLIKAINTFKSDKNIKLATYASRCIENEILMHLRRSTRSKVDLSFDEPLNVDWDGNELLLGDVLGSDNDDINRNLESRDEKNQLLRLVKALDERERQIMTLRFGLFGSKEYTQKQVADMLGISQSYISRLEKRIIGKLKMKMEKL